MKKIIFFTSFLILATLTRLFAQDNYYYYHNGDKINLEVNTNFFNLTVDDSFNKIDLDKVLGVEEKLNFVEDNSIANSRQGFYTKIEITEINSLEINDYLAKLNAVREISGVIAVNPSFKPLGDEPIDASKYLYIKLPNGKNIDILNDFVKDFSVEMIERNSFMPDWYTLSLTKSSQYDVVQTALKIYESGKVLAAVPDLLVKDQITCTNDEFFDDQWGLLNTNNPDIDINICEAWGISEGENIQIGVLDTGIEISHTDLTNTASSLVYDTESNSNNLVIYDGHGTHVAGIIGAEKDNSNDIAGVAPGGTLFSIGNSFAPFPNSRIRRADGINWAVQNGIDVLNNSWESDVPYQVIDDAILNALTNGRNGKGMVVVFSSGNDDSSVSYPATVSSDILTVGSIQINGQRSFFSNYGSELDIVAPGSNIKSLWTGNSTVNLSGTSMAASHVAGVAALILSINPHLTAVEVNDIIERTAQKIGNNTYGLTLARANGTWNNQMGHGLLDAHAAVLEAFPSRIAGTETFCTYTQETFTGYSIPQNATNLFWDYPSFFSATGQGTSQLTLSAYGANQIGSHRLTLSGEINGVSQVLAIHDFSLENSGSTSQVPSTSLHTYNPQNLSCCGQTYSFYQAECDYNCIDLEWEFTVHYQDSQDNYWYNYDTGMIWTTKNTTSPYILRTRARNKGEGCDTPSAWSNEITRYYGTLQNSSYSKSSFNALNKSHKLLPISISSDLDGILKTQYHDLYEWLDFHYSSKNLNEEEVSLIIDLITNYNDEEKKSIDIFDMNGVRLKSINLDSSSKNDQIKLNLSESGVYFVKLYFGKYEVSEKIVQR